MTVKFELTTFAPHVGTVFEATAHGYDEVLTLVEARPSRRAIEGADGQPFSLLLQGRRTDLYFNSGLVTLHHAVLGTMELAISPLGPRPDGTFEYQIVFN
ncbi:hypothetical protein [Sphingomonas sp. G-3-2-10]|uniref:DUF6916 family protein n=1 Tax=Sphingomonas sp. G-3-2-10 TaxID=2728838 RepID=UPI00146F7CDD|nr:hypothetical protein [Sphingomonas sp. G-3-2-10]NML07437.1 hypothetical protein [Sphingomonas sp. G-3-2-10]